MSLNHMSSEQLIRRYDVLDSDRTTQTAQEELRRMAGLQETQGELLRRGYSMSRSGRWVLEPTVTCSMCGGTHRANQSCECYDNGCQ